MIVRLTGFQKWSKFNTRCKDPRQLSDLKMCEPYLTDEELSWLNEITEEIEEGEEEISFFFFRQLLRGGKVNK